MCGVALLCVEKTDVSGKSALGRCDHPVSAEKSGPIIRFPDSVLRLQEDGRSEKAERGRVVKFSSKTSGGVDVVGAMNVRFMPPDPASPAPGMKAGAHTKGVERLRIRNAAVRECTDVQAGIAPLC